MTGTEKQFVIHEHKTSDGVHWDLMLEDGDHLLTYRLDSSPQDAPANPINAEKIFDHPLKFLTYQGPVQKGKGSVKIVDKGDYKLTSRKENNIKLFFNGKIFRGHFDLTLINTPVWCLTFDKK